MFPLNHTSSVGLSKTVLPWLAYICFLFCAAGIQLALVFSPEDYKQGEIVRIMYIHVPSAWLSLTIYGVIALLSFISLVWSNSIAAVLAYSAAPTGAVFSAICLITGSIWGKGYVGYMVGVGCKTYFNVNFIAFIYWVSFIMVFFY